jgi:hypothetical protein
VREEETALWSQLSRCFCGGVSGGEATAGQVPLGARGGRWLTGLLEFNGCLSCSMDAAMLLRLESLRPRHLDADVEAVGWGVGGGERLPLTAGDFLYLFF